MNKLWPHQQQIIDFANDRPYSLLYGGMGLGKTLAALVWLSGFDGIKVAITPKPVLSAWKEDHQNFGVNEPLLILDKGSSTAKQKQIDGFNEGIIVINYETARLLSWNRVPVRAAVFDEGHRLGIYNSKQSLVLSRAFMKVPHKLLMTGTPFHDSLTKVYGMVRAIDGVQPAVQKAHPQARIFGHYNNFLDDYCLYHQEGFVKMVYGHSPFQIKALASKLKPFTLSIKTEDVIEDLPDLISRNYYTEMAPDAKRAYKQLEKESYINIDDQDIFAPHLLTKIIRLQQLADSGVLVDENGKIAVTFDVAPRLSALDAIMETLSDEPIVIFTRFVRDAEILKNHIQEEISLLTGYQDTHEEWKAGKTRILIANIDAGSEGVRLERARHIIFWSIGWSAGRYHQAIGRVKRAGQKAGTVFAHCIITSDSVDTTIYNKINEKNSTRSMLENNLNGE